MANAVIDQSGLRHRLQAKKALTFFIHRLVLLPLPDSINRKKRNAHRSRLPCRSALRLPGPHPRTRNGLRIAKLPNNGVQLSPAGLSSTVKKLNRFWQLSASSDNSSSTFSGSVSIGCFASETVGAHPEIGLSMSTTSPLSDCRRVTGKWRCRQAQSL